MGEARRRRQVLIKKGLAQVAHSEEAKPKPLRTVLLQQQIHTNMDATITKLYEEEVNKEQIPLRSGFVERLILAGIASFVEARRQQAQAKQLIQPAGAQDVAAAVAQRDALAAQKGTITLR